MGGFSTLWLVATIAAATVAAMAIDVYWGSGSPYSWRVLLALEHKGLAYRSHLLQFSLQEHKSPQILSMNFRGRVPILRDGDYVVFESLAVLYYLDREYPDPPIFGRTAQEGGVIMRVICEYENYAEPDLMNIVGAFLAHDCTASPDDLARWMHVVGREARSIEARLAKSAWVVGESYSAADMVIFPGIRMLLRALRKPHARDLASRFLPLESNYPAIGRWIERIEALPGFERTFPPHWREHPV